jgi:hypothetical protein
VIADLLEDCDTVVVGRVVNSKTILVKDGRSIRNDYDLRISDVLKEPGKRFGTATVHTFGGTYRFDDGSTATVVIPSQPSLLVGSRYLIFANSADAAGAIDPCYSGTIEFKNDAATAVLMSDQTDQRIRGISGVSQTEILRNVRSTLAKGAGK